MSSVEADFDRLALMDDEGWTANNHYHNSLLRHVPQDCENALEIGCGTGAFARQLARRCRRVVALDLSSEMIRVARARSARLANLEYQLADAMTWSFPRAHFDFICSIATFHHTEQRPLLVKMKEALRPSGVLVVLDLVESSGFVERMIDVAGFGMSGALRLVHNGRLNPPAEVRKAWEQHGKHDSYATVSEMRDLGNKILPGSIVKRLLFWRYLLIYRNPPNSPSRDLGTSSVAKFGSHPL
jgi:ubiquinone/menaquinone biosynthesis C-methylase UbiE